MSSIYNVNKKLTKYYSKNQNQIGIVTRLEEGTINKLKKDQKVSDKVHLLCKWSKFGIGLHHSFDLHTNLLLGDN